MGDSSILKLITSAEGVSVVKAVPDRVVRFGRNNNDLNSASNFVNKQLRKKYTVTMIVCNSCKVCP